MGCCFKSNASVGCAPTARADAWFTLYERNLGDGPAHAVFTLAGPCQFSFSLDWIGSGSPPPFPGYGTIQIDNARVLRFPGSKPFSLSFNLVPLPSIRIVLNVAEASDWSVTLEATNTGCLVIA